MDRLTIIEVEDLITWIKENGNADDDDYLTPMQQLADTLRENERYKEVLAIADSKLKSIIKNNVLASALEQIAKCTSDPFATQCAWNALNGYSNKDSDDAK